jgi:hypothetical protein
MSRVTLHHESEGKWIANNQIYSDSKSLLLEAQAINATSSLTSIQLNAPACSKLTPSLVVSLSPLATGLRSLILSGSGGLRSALELHPLLIAPLGNGCLTVLDLTLDCRVIAGLFETLGNCCPQLESLLIWKGRAEDDASNFMATEASYNSDEEEGYDRGEGEEEMWDVDEGQFRFMLSKLRNLKTISLEKMRFTKGLDEEEGKGDAADVEQQQQPKLRGVALLSSSFYKGLVELFVSPHLKFLEISKPQTRRSWDEEDESEGKANDEEINAGEIVTIVGEKAAALTSLGL